MSTPEQLQSLLDEDGQLNAAVSLVLKEILGRVKSSRFVFFPEYTDHGYEHVAHVLRTASSLISDEAWEVVGADDAAVLALAIALHDLGMTLSEAEFQSLVAPKTSSEADKWCNDTPWPVLWDRFLAEATRFDARELHGLFGDTEPVRRPPADAAQMSRRDRILIGEFIRRHHHRLAHDISTAADSVSPVPIASLRSVPDYARDIAGFVARSHGMPIRACLKYLAKRYDRREYKGIHPAFLMALLRVSDFLHLSPTRASAQALRSYDLRSPRSVAYWRTTAAVRAIEQTSDDPEALVVYAEPPDGRTYLKIRHWIDSVQDELDTSWAVLGEVYGPVIKLRPLGLSVRRIFSNLDNEEEFARTVDYIPCHVAFGVGSAEILKLLVRPLYGNRLDCGVRELVQNAVDAVRELREHPGHCDSDSGCELEELGADVVVTLDRMPDESCWLVVADRGIGMLAETIRDYFLRAGASFRASPAWRERFEGSDGRSKVLRAGRFGVGVLAAFLLGEEIHVSTRHVSAGRDQAIEFCATLDTEAIDMRRIARGVGTTVRVRMHERDWNALKRAEESKQRPPGDYRLARFFEDSEEAWSSDWDWYCLGDPVVLRRITTDPETFTQRYHLPLPGRPLPAEWSCLSTDEFPEIHWTYSDEAPDLTCNGIRIPEGTRSHGSRRVFRHTQVRTPKLSVFDPDGRLPLNLERTALASRELPFWDKLVESVVTDFLAHSLVNAPHVAPRSPDDLAWYRGFSYPGFWQSGGWELDWGSWFWTRMGLGLTDPWHVREARISTALLCFSLESLPLDGVDHEGADALFCCRYGSGRSGLRILAYGEDLTGDWPFRGLRILGRRILIRKGYAQEMNRPYVLRADVRGRIITEFKKASWVCWRLGECGQPTAGFEGMVERWLGRTSDNSGPPQVAPRIGAVELWLEPTKEPLRISPGSRIWADLIAEPIIPFDLTSRQRLAARSTLLEQRVRAHRDLAGKKRS